MIAHGVYVMKVFNIAKCLLVGTKNVAKGLSKITRGRGIGNIKAQLLDKSEYSFYSSYGHGVLFRSKNV